MGLEQLKKEILDKADEEARKIAAGGKREAEEIAEKTREELKACRKSADDDLQKLLTAMERKAMASAESDVKKMKLDRKKEMIDNVFEGVRKKLSAMGDSEREAKIRKLFAKAKKEIQVRYVHANPNDRKIISRLSGAEYRETDISGGIVAESDDMNFCVDLSFDEILEDIKKRHLQEIAGKLFGQ